MNPPAALDPEAWSPWYPAELASRLSRIDRPWCIAGGWALDLWHGHLTREHHDLEFTILREDFSIFREALNGLEFYAAGNGDVTHLPAGAFPPATISQVWCQDIEDQRWRVDMMIEPGTPDTWVYKRDPTITQSRNKMVAITPDGIPYLRPAAILLFKAKYLRPKDEIDFQNALPKLATAERAWLKACLEKLHPNHEWTEML